MADRSLGEATLLFAGRECRDATLNIMCHVQWYELKHWTMDATIGVFWEFGNLPEPKRVGKVFPACTAIDVACWNISMIQPCAHES
jgi:hypothetical protein